MATSCVASSMEELQGKVLLSLSGWMSMQLYQIFYCLQIPELIITCQKKLKLQN